ncbi:MAG: SDR family NAD(P)-dependent oxidoreductase [Pseudomonadota bacterium]
MDLGLNGKVALVGGASRGLGYAIARSLSREGARVIITARTSQALQEAAEALRQETGGQVTAAPGSPLICSACYSRIFG